MARLMITIPDPLLAEMDQAAQREQRSRSQLLCDAVQQYLRIHQPTSATERSRTEALEIIEQLRLRAHLRAQQSTNSTEIIRSFRYEVSDETPSSHADKEL